MNFSDERSSLCYKDIRFIEDTMQLECSSRALVQDLSLKEAKLLRLFLQNPGRCFTKTQILAQVWHGTKVAMRTVDSQVSRLRQKLKATETTIVSVYRGGYKLE